MDTKKNRRTEGNLAEEIFYVVKRNKDEYFLRRVLAYALALEKALKK